MFYVVFFRNNRTEFLVLSSEFLSSKQSRVEEAPPTGKIYTEDNGPKRNGPLYR